MKKEFRGGTMHKLITLLMVMSITLMFISTSLAVSDKTKAYDRTLWNHEKVQDDDYYVY